MSIYDTPEALAISRDVAEEYARHILVSVATALGVSIDDPDEPGRQRANFQLHEAILLAAGMSVEDAEPLVYRWGADHE